MLRKIGTHLTLLVIASWAVLWVIAQTIVKGRTGLDGGVPLASRCGPPNYCARTDLRAVQLPSPIPQVGPHACNPAAYNMCGNLTGANTIVTDPDFGSRILRITDASTDSTAPNVTYITKSSGAGDQNICGPPDAHGIMLCAIDGFGANAPSPIFAIDTKTFQATKLYGPGQGIHISWFSYTNPNFGYVWNFRTPTIQRVDFSDRTTLPTVANGRITTIVDFRASPNCLPSNFVPTNLSAAGLSIDERTFGAGYSNAGSQGTGTFVALWKLGRGCRVWHTDTAQITGDWGPTGTMSLGTGHEFTIHGTDLGKGGDIQTLAPARCLNGTNCVRGVYVWQTGTLTVNTCTGQQGCAAHPAEGIVQYITPCTIAGYNGQQICIHPIANPATSFTQLTPNNPVGYGSTGIDRHPSWNSVNSTEQQVVLDASFANLTLTANGFDGPFPSAWYDEIMGYQPFLPQKVYRFAHTFNTNCGIGISAPACRFNLQDTIGSGTPDGRYFLWSSSWGRTLGSEGGGASCTENSTATRGGTLCRGDVFMVELK